MSRVVPSFLPEFNLALARYTPDSHDVIARLGRLEQGRAKAISSYVTGLFGVEEQHLLPLMLSAVPALGELVVQAGKATDIDFVDIRRRRVSLGQLRPKEEVVARDKGWCIWSAPNPAYREGDVRHARTLGVALVGRQLREFVITPGLETAVPPEETGQRVLRQINGRRTDQEKLLWRPSGHTATVPVIFHGLVSFTRGLEA